ncbi:hypothetical protein AVEN_42005-1 [Araneus ventricosus]|uniref:Uncharacterized protein n=1 Tax=Araneus ventricosus TaxID=182803 RepID=A0A4Y2EA38_ARAVE|nr:hypothetical protein AVEN_42005-1 [Araneus ventricosus]
MIVFDGCVLQLFCLSQERAHGFRGVHLQPGIHPGGVQRQVQGAGHLLLRLAARAQQQGAGAQTRTLRQRHPDAAGLGAQLHPRTPTHGLGRGARQRKARLLQEGHPALQAGRRQARSRRAALHRLLRGHQ